ncbi:hypothetical protein SNE40_019118 [Patella caerulea]|uniref:unspecific monooxygenase n=1 Tax=Patella caerulea TaxID=87958 RepID=A0AAN8PEJ1_PATCE
MSMIQEMSKYFVDPNTRIQATLITFFTTLIGAKVIMDFVKRDNQPPGPLGVPLLGYLPFFGRYPHLTFSKLREKYGDIFSVKMGSFPAVVINGKDLIKEAFVGRGDDFSGRPRFYSNTILGEETMSFGVFDERTISHKKMAANKLLEFASARKNPIEDIVDYEAKIAVTEFAQLKGKPFYPKDIIYSGVGSVIFQICYGKHTNIREEDSYFKDFILSSSEFSEFVGTGNPVDVMPWMRFIMPWKVTKFVELVTSFKAIRNKKIEENLESFCPSNIRHLTDGIIAAANEHEADPNSTLSRERIYSTIDDIMGAGFETVSTLLNWAILLLTAYPKAQEMVHAEIDNVLGKRPPRLQDKAKMPYCMATVHEVLRFSNIAPLAIPHAATKDTELSGYTIRRGTIIIPNMHSISHDKDIWGDPFNFRPDRFLDSEGQLDQTTTERFNVFSLGRRKCLGEFLARMEIFLFLTGIFQNCKFTKPANVKQYTFDSIFGLTNVPAYYETCASIRD